MMYSPEKLKDLSTQNLESRLATEALQIQNACNLSGLVFGFSSAMQLLCELSHRDGNAGTEFKNRHPITILWVSKLDSLSGASDFDAFSKAYDWCEAHKEISCNGDVK